MRTPDSKPAVNVRVAAMAAPDGGDVVNGTALISLTQTDESGRFLLDIEPGRYLVIAGLVDQPTYYPGATSLAGATIIEVTQGASLKDFDFVALAALTKPAVPTSPRAVEVSGRLVLEDVAKASKLPGSITLATRTEAVLAVGGMAGTWYTNKQYYLSINPDGTFRVSLTEGETSLAVSGVPPGYSVKSISFGSSDLLKERLDSRPRTTPLPEIVITLAPDPPAQRED